jgi:hypothetical protein
MIKELKDQVELSQLFFASIYNSNYRYYKSNLLLNEYEKLESIIPDLTANQYENLRQMVEIELIVNAVQYCNDLGAIAICVKKRKINELGYMLASLSDQSNVDFYKSIDDLKLKDLKKYMGYHDIDTNKGKNEKYIRSCERYQSAVSEISKFYIANYELYISYKHGLRIAPIADNKGNNMFIISTKNYTLRKHMRPIFYGPNQSIQVNDIIKNIFNKLYDPLFRKTLHELLESEEGSDNNRKGSVKADINLIKPMHKFSFSFAHPWQNSKDFSLEPFY